MSDSQIIAATQRWLDTMVIGHNFCPFARFVQQANSIHYTVCHASKLDDIMLALHRECQRLDQQNEVSTTLIMLPALNDFDQYLDMLDLAQVMLGQWHYEGTYQLASFHPDYLFEGEPANAPSHFTNRSPFPTLHILREAEISEALKFHDDPAAIFENNLATTQALGGEQLAAELAQCRAESETKA